MDELRGLIESHLVAIELERHHEVSENAIRIQKKLIQLLDEQLLDANDNLEASDLLLSEILESICQKLRVQAELAATYGDVLQFVHVRVGIS